MLKELTKKEFEKRYPEVSTYGLDYFNAIFLENGVILCENEWNGEVYIVKEKKKSRIFRPAYSPCEFDESGECVEWDIVGYSEQY